MTPKLFVKSFLKDAQLCEKTTGISAIAILAQAALESGWGEFAPNNMFFGIKDTDGVNGNEQLLTTTEYSRSANYPFPNIISVTPVIRNGQKWFKYKIKDYFRKYNTPAESFIDHSQFFLKNKRYAKALLVKSDYNKFFDEIAKAGYATAPNYADFLKSIAKTIVKNI
jgi:flagellum-specific peptidoglycan hydrolase FlgJ